MSRNWNWLTAPRLVASSERFSIRPLPDQPLWVVWDRDHDRRRDLRSYASPLRAMRAAVLAGAWNRAGEVR